jgi:hypothetical protein
MKYHPTPKWPADKLPEVVAKYNTMADALNLMVPRIADAIEGARVTKNKVGKTTRENIQDIICRFALEGMQVYLDTSYIYGVYLVARFSVPVGGPSAGVDYFEQSVQIANRDAIAVRDGLATRWNVVTPIEPLPRLQVSEVQQQLIAVQCAANRCDDAEEQLRMVIYTCRQFLKGI